MTKTSTKTIWIVDDDEGILEVIDIILQEEGYHTKIVNNGMKLTDLLLREKPNLILLDILMSGYDGREISRKIKDNPKTSEIPIIIMSANTKVEEKSVEARADAYLMKPFDINTLLEIVKNYV